LILLGLCVRFGLIIRYNSLQYFVILSLGKNLTDGLASKDPDFCQIVLDARVVRNRVFFPEDAMQSPETAKNYGGEGFDVSRTV